jgi:hypothetical protein
MNTGHMSHSEGKDKVIFVYVMEVYSGRRGIVVPLAGGEVFFFNTTSKMH